MRLKRARAIYDSVWIAVDVSGPISIDKLNVVPNDIRGIIAWVAR